jgi:hypothetical protein
MESKVNDNADPSTSSTDNKETEDDLKLMTQVL